MAIYVAAHYKNSPDDLQMLSDAPAHHIFVLMAPVTADQTSVPQILAVVQLCLEGSISKKSVTNNQQKGKRAAGDVIPWTLCQQFLDTEFPTLCGARIVRVAVHPDFQGMGYGSRAIHQLQEYYEGHYSANMEEDQNDEDVTELATKCDRVEVVEESELRQLLNEDIVPRANLPPLLIRLKDRPSERLDYIGVSFGLTLSLLKFWKRLDFVPVYLRQNTNDLTGEHSCIMVKTVAVGIPESEQGKRQMLHTKNSDGTWLPAFFNEFRKRFVSLLSSAFVDFTPQLAFSLMVMNRNIQVADKHKPKVLDRDELRLLLSDLDLNRLSQYSRNLADHHLITDLLPIVANLYFNGQLEQNVSLELSQAAVLLGVGLQRKNVDAVAGELGLPAKQAYALLNKAIRRLSDHFDSICRETIERQQHFPFKSAASTTDQQKHQPEIKKMKISQF